MGGSYIMKTSTKLHKGEALERTRQEGEKQQAETLLQQRELKEYLLKQQWELETEYFYYSIQYFLYLLVKHICCVCELQLLTFVNIP